MAGGNCQDRAPLERCVHGTVIDISHRIPQQRALVCHHQLSGLADPDFRLRLDRDKSRLILLQHCLLTPSSQPAQCQPLLSVLGHILPLIGTDRAELRGGFIAFDGAGRANQHG
ncbi:hypothetical protein D9M72_552110 [compost metagenome]